jgi:norsolorinic acid ketoreductase
MVPEEQSVYLVTGATRGIGRELVKQLSSNVDVQVIAAVRTLDSIQTKSLKVDFPRVVVVKIDSEVDTDPSEAVKKLTSLGIKKVDTIFANAGLYIDAGDAVNVKAEQLRQLFNVNAIAPLLLFQAFKSLMEKSLTPRFISLGTGAASLTNQASLPFKTTCYGTSKAALNFIAVRLAIENTNIITVIVHPGIVDTDMGAGAVVGIGQTMEAVIESGMGVTVEHSVKNVIQVAKKSTLKDTSGQFIDANSGQVIPW